MLVDYFTYGQPLREITASVPDLDAAGLDGWFVAESDRDPFLAAAIAAEHSHRLVVGTGIAIALVRSPMSVAYLAHGLQEFSGGRFVLGLGSQVKAHVVRRFGAEWGNPVGRMREFIAAFRTIWDAWNQQSELSFEGTYYTHTLMPPEFRPANLPQPIPPILLAAVGPEMTRLAGMVADGVLCHPFSGPRYLRQVTLPAISGATAQAGRPSAEVSVSGSVLVATGATQDAIDSSVRETRKRLGFYAATPAYRRVLEVHGWGELHEEARRLARMDRWDQLASIIDDDAFDEFAVRAQLRDVGKVIAERYSGLLDRVNIATSHTFSPTEWRHILEDLHGASGRTEDREEGMFTASRIRPREDC